MRSKEVCSNCGSIIANVFAIDTVNFEKHVIAIYKHT